jgi:hypothetical protein
MPDAQVPSDEQIRLAMLRTMEQMFLHSEANTKTLLSINAKLAGVEAGSNAVAQVVDENDSIAAAKEIISHLYEKSHQYVVVVIGGAFAAYFATLGAVSARFTDTELRVSALLMTVSLTVFVLWEVANITHIGIQVMKGNLGERAVNPTWMRIGWPLAMFFSLATALPAIGLSVSVYLRGLGAAAYLQLLLS